MTTWIRCQPWSIMFSFARPSERQVPTVCKSLAWWRDRQTNIPDKAPPAVASSFTTQCSNSYGSRMSLKLGAIKLGERSSGSDGTAIRSPCLRAAPVQLPSEMTAGLDTVGGESLVCGLVMNRLLPTAALALRSQKGSFLLKHLVTCRVYAIRWGGTALLWLTGR